MAAPSLKTMESQTKEGIYASSNAPCNGKMNSSDLGLTLFPGLQIQREDEDQGHSWQGRIQEGRGKGGISLRNDGCRFREVGTEVASQKTPQSSARIGSAKEKISEVGGPKHVPELAELATDHSSDELLSSPSHKELTRGESYPFDAPVSELSFQIPRLDVGCKAIELPRSPTLADDVEAVGFFLDVGRVQSSAEDNLDVLRPHKRPKIGDYVPLRNVEGLQEACVDRSKAVVEVRKRNLCGSSEVGSSGVKRSRSHSPTNSVARFKTSASFKDLYPPPRSCSLPSLSSLHAQDSRLQRLNIPLDSSNLVDITTALSPRTELNSVHHRQYQPPDSVAQTSGAMDTYTQSMRSPQISNRFLQMTPSAAPEIFMANFPDTTYPGNYVDFWSPLESTEGHITLPTGDFGSAESTFSFDQQGADWLPQLSTDPASFSLSIHQNDLAEDINSINSNTMGSTRSPFTTFNNWQFPNTIDQTTSFSNLSNGVTTHIRNNPPINNSIERQFNTLVPRDSYKSPYAPKPYPTGEQSQPQIQSADLIANNGSITEDRGGALTASSVSTGPHPFANLLPQSSYTSSTNTTSILCSRLYSQDMQSIRPSSDSPMAHPPSAHQTNAPTPMNRISGTSQQSSSGSSGTRAEVSTEQIRTSGKEILLPPELVIPAKRAIDTICPELLKRMHHGDIVPRVLSFIKTFSLPGDAPSATDEVSAADHSDLLQKNQSLLDRLASVGRERDKYRKAAHDWITVDPVTGNTKGQTVTRELRKIRAELSRRTEEVEQLKNAWKEFEAARAAAALTSNTSTIVRNASHGHTSNSQHGPPFVTTYHSIQSTSQGGSLAFPTAAPTPPGSQRVSIDLTDDNPAQPSTSSALPAANPPHAAPSAGPAALRNTMKRKAYAWLPPGSNHMVKKAKPTPPGSQPSTPIELDLGAPASDADADAELEAELERELERELLAAQQVEEQEKQRVARNERRKAKQNEKYAAMKVERETAKREQAEKEREERGAEERRKREAAARRERVVEEQRRKEAEQQAWDEDLFGPEDVEESGEGSDDE